MLQKYLLRQLYTSGTFKKKQYYIVWPHLLVSLRYVGIQNLSRQSLHNSLCIFQHSHSLKGAGYSDPASQTKKG